MKFSVTLINGYSFSGELMDNKRVGDLDGFAMNNTDFLIFNKDGQKILVNKNNILHVQEQM